jgi:pimeloyl-ACP methyl ester carboxylesterase
MDLSDCAATADAIEQGKPPVLLLRALGLPLPPAAATTGQMQSPEVRRALAVAFSAECLTRRRVTVEELAAAGVPALAIVGELDAIAPSVRAMVPHMLTLEVIVISGAAHFTALGDPAFIDAASKFLSQKRSTSR